MTFWTAVVIIVAIWALVRIMQGRSERLGTRFDEQEWGENQEDGPSRPGPREEALQSEIERLRERLEVLERIATDANSHEARERRRLEAEIDDLRDDK